MKQEFELPGLNGSSKLNSSPVWVGLAAAMLIRYSASQPGYGRKFRYICQKSYKDFESLHRSFSQREWDLLLLKTRRWLSRIGLLNDEAFQDRVTYVYFRSNELQLFFKKFKVSQLGKAFRQEFKRWDSADGITSYESYSRMEKSILFSAAVSLDRNVLNNLPEAISVFAPRITTEIEEEIEEKKGGEVISA